MKVATLIDNGVSSDIVIKELALTRERRRAEKAMDKKLQISTVEESVPMLDCSRTVCDWIGLLDACKIGDGIRCLLLCLRVELRGFNVWIRNLQ